MKKIKIIALLVMIVIVSSSCTRTKVEYFEDGSVKSSIPYRFGKENGLCKYYFINAPHPIKIEVEMASRGGRCRGRGRRSAACRIRGRSGSPRRRPARGPCRTA